MIRRSAFAWDPVKQDKTVSSHSENQSIHIACVCDHLKVPWGVTIKAHSANATRYSCTVQPHLQKGMTGKFTMTKKKKKFSRIILRDYLHASNTITKSMQFNERTQVCKVWRYFIRSRLSKIKELKNKLQYKFPVYCLKRYQRQLKHWKYIYLQARKCLVFLLNIY